MDVVQKLLSHYHLCTTISLACTFLTLLNAASLLMQDSSNLLLTNKVYIVYRFEWGTSACRRCFGLTPEFNLKGKNKNNMEIIYSSDYMKIFGYINFNLKTLL